jgi:G3E family GTPase
MGVAMAAPGRRGAGTGNRQPEDMVGPVPVVILTGFLGSGKTTLLNHLLDHARGQRLGIVLNDFGQIAIDARLVRSRDNDVVELANGCVCCTVRDDVLPALARLLDRAPMPQAVVVETSGLADPAPLAERLLDPRIQAVVRLDAVVTVVDAANVDRALDHAESAYSQITSADLLILNKVDLVAPAVVAQVERGLRQLNATARVVRAVRAQVEPALLLDWPEGQGVKGPAGVGGAAASGADAGPPAHAPRHTRFHAVTVQLTRPLDLPRLGQFLDGLPPTVFRAKGVLHLAGVPCRVVLHLVAGRWTMIAGAPWASEEVRTTEVVFIGLDLGDAERSDLRRALEACQTEMLL